MSTQDEVFFSIDIEADGPIPVSYSMISFGVVAFTAKGEVLGTYEANLEPTDGATQHPDTMEFWARNSEAWDYVNSNQRPAEDVMPEFVKWANAIPAKRRTAVCYPSGFDFTFMYMYMMKFVGSSPFMFSCIDMRSYVAGMRKTAYGKSGKGYWPNRWRKTALKHTHKALDDAAEQGLFFLRISAENVREEEGALNEVSSLYLKTLRTA